MKYYKEFKPSKHIQHLVECFWYNKIPEDYKADSFDLIVPDGCTEAIIMLNGSYTRISDTNDSFQKISDSHLIFSFSSAIKVIEEPHSSCLGIRFRPGALKKLVGLANSEFTQPVISLKELFPELAEQLQNDMFRKACLNKLIQTITKNFEKRIQLDSFSDLTPFFIKKAILTKGSLSISEFCDIANIHKTTLNRYINEDVGLTPKQYCKIVRYNFLLGDLYSKNQRLTEIAHNYGFFDQSHFNKEFKSITGINPSTFVQKNYALPPMMVHAMKRRAQYYS